MALPPRARIMPPRRHLFLVLSLAAAVATRAATADRAASSPTSSAAAEKRSAEPPAPASSFLRDRCATTLYQELCYDALLPYAPKFGTSRARLARAAADVAAARLRALSTRVKEIIGHGGGGGGGDEPPAAQAGWRPSEAAALRDCASTVSAAAEQARRSSAELAKLDPEGGGGSSGGQARWEVSNAKTWLSAAVTDEGTCADGIQEAAATASPAGKEVTAGVASVKQYTSIALALVNGIPV